MPRLTEILESSNKKRETVVMCTIVDSSGSTPLKAGAKMVVWRNGVTAGTIGGGNLEKNVISDALQQINFKKPLLKEYNLLQQEMCCGGKMLIFIEPMYPQKQIIIFGAGHVGKHVAYFASKLNFRVIVADERKEMISQLNVPDAELIQSHHTEAFGNIRFDEYTYIVICTHSHAFDREILAYCLRQPHAYLGMIGSKRKVAMTRKLFLQHQLADTSLLDKVDMPIGLDIGQNSPAEIGLSIVAGIVSFINHKSTDRQDKTCINADDADNELTCIK